MKFGIFSMPEHAPWENWTLSYDLDLEKIQTAEHLGFDEYWVGEHHAGGYENVPVPDYYIAKASALTNRIRLGTGTINLPYHDPFPVAERMAFLDHLTHGRLIAGFGGGGLPFDQALFGTADTAAQRFEEALPVVTKLFEASEPFSHDGEFYTFKDRELQVRPLQDPLPIAVAGLRSPGKYELCGRNGYAAMSMYYVRPDGPADGPLTLKSQGEAIERGAREAGRDPVEARMNWRILREVYVSDSKQSAIDELREAAQKSYDYIIALGAGGLLKADPEESNDVLTLEYLVENLPMIFGSPDDCIRQLHELRETVGPFGTLVINDRNWVTSDKWRRSNELFMRYVAPAFKKSEEQLRRRRLVDDVMTKSEIWPTDWWNARPVVPNAGEPDAS